MNFLSEIPTMHVAKNYIIPKFDALIETTNDGSTSRENLNC